SMLSAAFLMPILGELSDKLKRRRPFLVGFTLGCVIFTALLGLVKGVFPALLFFCLANFCYQLAAVSYNSLLTQVSTPLIRGRTSGLGVSLGYLGTILGLVLVKPFLDFGGRQATFIPTAALFLLFALPAFIFIKDPPYPHIPKIELQIKSIFSRLLKGLAQVRQDPRLSNFLLSAFWCLNAVNAIVVYMGIYASRVMGFNDGQIIHFMIVSTIFAVAGSYAFGYLIDRWGSKRTLSLVLKLWCLTIFLAAIARSNWLFWMIGPTAGICLGGTWVATRTMLIELIPQQKISQMFGIFGLLHMLSFILGTTIWGIITTWSPAGWGELKYRIAIASLLIFMLHAYRTFQRVPDPRKVGA
ncbi:MAG: MFS transporter, partial [Candidatus Omnitrophica bacterium]|nr:MFS transporter [Candidatus Omnitrophota bacterium]